SVCALCLSRQPHNVRHCQATKTWDGQNPRCRREPNGLLSNPSGRVLCMDWQLPSGCRTPTMHPSSLHECS
ncbi:hypothetical protein NEOLEDRAFT_1020193, partial [Neolentinus lepideus HHB14362 ss-1]